MRPRKKISMYIMATIYVAAGILHFVKPDTYISIVPDWLPYPLALVYISGVVEIAGGLLLLPVATRRFGAWLIILLLIAVFPANVQMAVDSARSSRRPWWFTLGTILRFPLQAPMIRIALKAARS